MLEIVEIYRHVSQSQNAVLLLVPTSSVVEVMYRSIARGPDSELCLIMDAVRVWRKDTSFIHI